MSSNSLVNFQLLFQQSEQNIKKLLSLISPFVEKKNTAIANFLAVEQVKLIWLIRILNAEYDKQFSSSQNFQWTAIENIAKSILLNLNETNTLNYSQIFQNNIVYNQSFLFHLPIMTTCLLIKMILSHFLVTLTWNTYKTLITPTPLSLTIINYPCNNFPHNFLLPNTLQLSLTNLLLIIITINLTRHK